VEPLTEKIVASALYVVATPIGNLADISQRALHILRGVDQIAAEDTRHSRRLLAHYGINASLISLHEHNEQGRVQQLQSNLQRGQSIALISDAGTPLISDPGYSLVRQVSQSGYRVIPVPGACAAVAALSVAGLTTDAFVFAGFSPTKAGARIRFFERLRSQTETFVFYESPNRLIASLEALSTVIGGTRQLVVARELTKLHETILRGDVAELLKRLRTDPDQCRGEIVVLVAGVSKEEVSEFDADAERLLEVLLKELPVTRAAHVLAQFTGLPRRQVYQRALELQK